MTSPLDYASIRERLQYWVDKFDALEIMTPEAEQMRQTAVDAIKALSPPYPPVIEPDELEVENIRLRAQLDMAVGWMERVANYCSDCGDEYENEIRSGICEIIGHTEPKYEIVGWFCQRCRAKTERPYANTPAPPPDNPEKKV